MLSALLAPALRERFPDRGLVVGRPPAVVAWFPGLHPGIRGVSVYDEGDELTVSVDDVTHGHFAESDESLSVADREARIVAAAADFLDDLFADRVAVWGRHDTAGGWRRVDLGDTDAPGGTPEFVWSGPR